MKQRHPKQSASEPVLTEAIILCNGESPRKKVIAPLLKERPIIVCADGGANKAIPLGLTPDVIIGDLDSVTRKTLRYFFGVPVIYNPDQNSTDLEKALDFLLANGIRSATVIGATGERPDHTMSNFSILLKYHNRLSLRFLDDLCTAEIVQSRIQFRTSPGRQISLIPMGKCIGVTTRGLKFPLNNESLSLGVREGSSNEATGTIVSVSVKRGSLLLFKIYPGRRLE